MRPWEVLNTSISVAFIEMSANENNYVFISTVRSIQRTTSIKGLGPQTARSFSPVAQKDLAQIPPRLVNHVRCRLCRSHCPRPQIRLDQRCAPTCCPSCTHCPTIRVSVLAIQIVQSASMHSFKLVFVVPARKRSVTGIQTRKSVTDVPPARASRCSSACQQLEKGLTCRPPVPAVAAPPVSNLKRAQ